MFNVLQSNGRTNGLQSNLAWFSAGRQLNWRSLGDLGRQAERIDLHMGIAGMLVCFPKMMADGSGQRQRRPSEIAICRCIGLVQHR